MVESYKKAAAQGKGSAVLEGKMIDYATYAMGLDVIAQAEGIAKKAILRREKI
jgi:citrate lyase beta subunit